MNIRHTTWSWLKWIFFFFFFFFSFLFFSANFRLIYAMIMLYICMYPHIITMWSNMLCVCVCMICITNLFELTYIILASWWWWWWWKSTFNGVMTTFFSSSMVILLFANGFSLQSTLWIFFFFFCNKNILHAGMEKKNIKKQKVIFVWLRKMDRKKNSMFLFCSKF